MNTFLHFIDVEIKAGGKKGERIAANCPRDNAVHAVATDSFIFQLDCALQTDRCELCNRADTPQTPGRNKRNSVQRYAKLIKFHRQTL